ncbi:MAG: DUF58 domain-containing protein [Myxococcota bacterium]
MPAFSKRTFRFTREGKVFLAVTGGVGIAAVNTGNNLLYLVLGLMLSTLLVSGILSELALRGARVRRSLPRGAFEGQPCLVEVALANRKRRVPSFSLAVEDRTEAGPVGQRAYFLKVAAGTEQVVAYRFVPPRRGHIRFESLHLRTRYPFGLIEKGRRVRAADVLLAYPALVPVSDNAVRADSSERAEIPLSRTGVGSEVAGVREYRPLDEARAIHWRRTASLGRVVVRERHQDAVDHDLIDLEQDGDFEQAVRRAASRAVRALARGSAAQVRHGADRSPTVLPGAPADPILAYLALVEPEPRRTADAHDGAAA